MILEVIFRGAFSSIEFVNRDSMLVGASKEVPTVGESDLTAELDADLLECLECFLEHIHHADFISETNDNVEPRGVECQ
jgi:hypothetical protein